MLGFPFRYSPPVPSGVEESCKFRVQVERRPLAKKALPSTSTTDGATVASSATTQRFAIVTNNGSYKSAWLDLKLAWNLFWGYASSLKCASVMSWCGEMRSRGESEAVVTSVDRQLATRGIESIIIRRPPVDRSARRWPQISMHSYSSIDAAPLILCCIAILRTQIV